MRQPFSLKLSDFQYQKETRVRTVYFVIGGILTVFLLMSNPVFLVTLITACVLFGFSLYMNMKASIATYVKVSPTQFPEIYQLSVEAAHRLEVPMPNIYVKQSPIINAFTMGLGKNHEIVIHSALIEALNPKELQAVIGHEMGHIKAGHVLYFFLTQQALSNPILIGLLGPVKFVLNFAMMFLSRCQEYTADRAGLIACGNVYDSITSELKLTVGKELFQQLNLKEYFRQMDEVSNDKLNFLTELSRTHPFPVKRIREMVQFYRSPAYQNIKTRLGEGGTSILQTPPGGTMELLDRIVDKYHNGSSTSNQVAAAKQTIPSQSVSRKPSNAQPVSTEKKCTACATDNQADSVFCFNCGNKLS